MATATYCTAVIVQAIRDSAAYYRAEGNNRPSQATWERSFALLEQDNPIASQL